MPHICTSNFACLDLHTNTRCRQAVRCGAELTKEPTIMKTHAAVACTTCHCSHQAYTSTTTAHGKHRKQSQHSHGDCTASTSPVADTCGHARALRPPHALQPAATAPAAARPAFSLCCSCLGYGSLRLPCTPPAAAAARRPAQAPPAWTPYAAGCCHQQPHQSSCQLSLQLGSPLCWFTASVPCYGTTPLHHCSQRRNHA